MFLLITKAKQMYLHKDNLEEQKEYKRGTNRKKKSVCIVMLGNGNSGWITAPKTVFVQTARHRKAVGGSSLAFSSSQYYIKQ